MSAPYMVQARSDPFWGERPPRGYSRHDRIDLNLFDAGHGDQVQARNPILLGMGVTLRLRLNSAVRTWRVFIRDVGAETEITHLFQRVAPRMFELRGTAGAGALNPENRPYEDWTEAVRLDIRVETRNVTLESNFYASLWVQDDDTLMSCQEPCMDDFEMLQAFGRQRVRLWRDYMDPTRQPADTTTNTFIFLFEQAEELIALSNDIALCYNYHTLVMVGVKFFIIGDCEQSALLNP